MLRFVIVTLLFLAAFPFIVLSGLGQMKPAEGFCMEHGQARSGHAPTAQEASESYFVSPELAPAARWWNDVFPWPVCVRSRRGEHRFWARAHDQSLARLEEANLSRLNVEQPRARVLRVLTAPSFSRDPIAVQVRDGSAVASWLVDDDPSPSDDPEAYEVWRSVRLPVVRAQAPLTAEESEAFWRLARQARHREYWNLATLDGNWLVIEMIEQGRREVRFVLLRGGPETDLFCGLAARAGVPERALLIGDVVNECAPGEAPVRIERDGSEANEALATPPN